MGAVGGNNGEDLIISTSNGYVPMRWNLEQRINNNRASSGKNGTDGGNSKGISEPIDAIIIDEEQPNIINEYKKYLRENIKDRFLKHSISQFLNQLDNDNNVKKAYNTLGLVNELQGLEEQFHKLNESVDFLPFYQSLLNRISAYAQSPKNGEKSIQHKKVLNYLYTAILGRIYNLNDETEFNLVIDVSGYLDIVKTDVENLKDLAKASNKADVINRHKENYKNNIDKKIEEARNFIEKKIAPEIDNISTQIDNQVDLLIDETIALQKQAEKERENLIKKKRELEHALQLRGLFSFLQISGQVISFLGPAGAAVGSVIGAVNSITESLVLDKEGDQKRTLQLPPSVISNIRLLGDKIKTARNQKLSYLKKLLEQISEEAIKYPEKLRDTSAKLADIKKRLDKVSENKFNFKEVRSLENEIKEELKRKEGELKIQNVDTDKKAADALAVVEKLKQFAQLAEVGFDIYNKYKGDETKLNAVSEAIEQAEKKFQLLKDYEEKIYNIINPMLQDMTDKLHDIANKLDTKSQVALDVTKWQVQGTLKDMKLQMQQLTEGFEVKGNLTRCIEKLDEAMTTLINVYDRIQNYQDQQNLANYIADISSTIANNINLTEPFSSAVNRLDVLIRSNLILNQYKSALAAFKQFVFPFARLYLEKFTLPAHLELENNVGNLVSKAITQIENIKKQVDVYKTSIKGYDKYIHTGEFSSNYVSTKPFFVWENEKYKDVITKLLSGQEIILKSDIINSAPDKDAVKFSAIDLYFKAQNETIQSKINNTLKAFKVIATHLGNSYYKQQGKIYVIESESQTLTYSFEKNPLGVPVDKNKVYDKIKEGDLMLSPYAMWKIMLIDSTKRVSFSDLKIYADEIDLELVGIGSYVDTEIQDLDLQVDHYYKAIDEYNQVDLNIQSESIVGNGNTTLSSRSIRSMPGIDEIGDYVANNAAAGLYSPINYMCNLLKENTMLAVSNIMTSINEILIGSEESVENHRDSNNCCDDSEIYTGSTENEIKDATTLTSRITTEEEATRKELIDVAISGNNTKEQLNYSTNDESILTLKKGTLIRNNGLNELSYVNVNGNSNFMKPRLSNEKQDVYNIRSVQLPEVNSSLLLADLVSRHLTGIKYESPLDESLLSPPEWIARKITEGVVQSEDDINQNFCRLLVKLDASNPWLDRMMSYIKSTCQFLGYFKEDKDDYIPDVSSLFSGEASYDSVKI